MNLWRNRQVFGAIVLLLGAGLLEGCADPNYGYGGYPAYGGYGYPAYGSYGYPAYGDYGGGVVIGGGWGGGFDHRRDWDRHDHDGHHEHVGRSWGQVGANHPEHHEGATRAWGQSSGVHAANLGGGHQETAHVEAHHGNDHDHH